MCTPTAYVVMTLATTAMSMKAASDQADYESDVAAYNKRVAENDAQKLRNVGTEKENIQRQKTAQLISKQKAQLGAFNVQLGTGSAVDIQEDTAMLGEIDAMRIRSNTDEAVTAKMSQATLIESEGKNAQVAGRNKQIGTMLGAASSIAGTAVNNKWYTPNSSAKIG